MSGRFLIALTAIVALTASSALAQSNDPAWLDDLQIQMEQDEGCTVDLFINIDEGTLGTSRYYQARVQCRDGRLFDASRTEPENAFTIRKCQIAVC